MLRLGRQFHNHDVDSLRTSSESSPLCLKISEYRSDRLAYDASPVYRHTVPSAQRQPCLLQRQQLLGADVDGDLLLVADPPGLRSHRWFPVA